MSHAYLGRVHSSQRKRKGKGAQLGASWDYLMTSKQVHWRRKWQPTPVFLPGESQGWRSLVGCHLWGHTESDTTEAMQQQQAGPRV